MLQHSLFTTYLSIALLVLVGESSQGQTHTSQDDSRSLKKLIQTLNQDLAKEGDFDEVRDQRLTAILLKSHLKTAVSSEASAKHVRTGEPAVAPPVAFADSLVERLDLNDATLIEIRNRRATEIYRFARSAKTSSSQELRILQLAFIESELGRVISIRGGGAEVALELGERRFTNAARLSQFLNVAGAARTALEIAIFDSRFNTSLLFRAGEDCAKLFEDFLNSFAENPYHGVGSERTVIGMVTRNMLTQLDLSEVWSAIDRTDLGKSMKSKLRKIAQKEQTQLQQ